MKGVSVSVLAVWTLGVSTLVAATWPSPLVSAPSRAGVVPQAKNAGARVVIVNDQPTPFDDIADAVLRGPIGEILPALCAS